MRRILSIVASLFRHAVVWLVVAMVLAPFGWLAWAARESAPLSLQAIRPELTNSLLNSATVAAICLLFAPTAGYALSRSRFPGRRFVLVAFAAVLLAPLTLLLIPQALVLRTVGLYDSPVGVILAQLGGALALAVWILKAAFDRLPPELEEYGRLEGASPARLFWRVALPSVRVPLVCAVLIAFAASWGEYLFSSTFLVKAVHFTMPAAIVSASRTDPMPLERFAPLVLIASAPPALLLLIVQTRLRDLIPFHRLAPRPLEDASS